ncbi:MULTISPECIES: bifunctional methylenetetrahydrofolate dehydrogenase/methenyltetrahydrofolate cyclohydrolase FolD [unclassified Burkholderia]|uniref:bifunctional 5,10-methylenetetrahydrofolate dehydrogenase/5,10-methenyltetrahydrofolate cyclohydrolase n=1 Tax=unclassified Burkholderia TaxID=2613784 RepID=UPI002ABE674C|nr:MULTISPECIES: bifunctional methylenetetrahydrofolate dehydrogenase/methenyltetrahydrofolate cyclohydrolase FolD [unclassified Burkholderia]
MSGATIIDGKAIADALLESVRHDVARLRGDGVLPGLAVVLVGDDPASHVYVRNKMLRAQQVGIRSIEHRLPADTAASALLALVAELNADPDVHGILVQMPLPAPLDAAAVIDAIDPRKDVDGFHRDNVGGLALGQDSLVPCTPSGCMHLLREIVGDLRGKHAVVVGRSNIVGKPMAALLLQSDCSVTTVHSRSANAAELCRQADIVVAAAGKPGLVDADWIKPGAVVVDVGINRIESGGATRLVGDVDHDSVARVAAALTPVPGGVGPLTIAFLMKNTALAARRQRAT